MSANSGKVAFGLILNFLSLIGDLLTPQFTGLIIQAIIEKDWDRCYQLSMILFCVNVVVAIFTGAQTYQFGWVAVNIGCQLRQDLFDEILHKDVEFFDGRKTGDLMSRMEADTAKVENGLSNQLAALARSTVYCICVVVIIFI